MAATATWYEDNGVATGSPAKGATRGIASNVDWKSVDDISTPRNDAVIIAGQNSYHKYQFVKFGGSFNEISVGRFGHTAGTPVSVTLVGKVTSSYATPNRSALSGAIDISYPNLNLDDGIPVLFSSIGPEGTASSKLTSAGYSQYIVSQLQTAQSSPAGEISNQILTLQWNEN